MPLQPDEIFAEWDQAIAELIASNDKLMVARQGGNPASVARAWSTVRSTEARLNAVGNQIEPIVENWLKGGG